MSRRPILPQDVACGLPGSVLMTTARRRRWLPVLATSLALAMLVPAGAQEWSDAERFWAQWRGPYQNGMSRTATPPVEWSETTNIKWKTELPGLGAASPVVWGDRLFLLSAVPVGVSDEEQHQYRGALPVRDVHRYVVLAIDRSDGHIVWERVAGEQQPHEATHASSGTYASSSAITDGEHVIAFFESNGLYVYDMDGTLVWSTDLGNKRVLTEGGEGTTPALYGNTLVLVWDNNDQSFIVAFDKRTGEELWRVARDELDTWSTPIIVEHGGRAQVVTNGWSRIRSYDLETGELLWHTTGLTPLPIPSPVAGGGMVFATSGFNGSVLKAISLVDARGDITGTGAIVWSLDRDTPYVSTPLLYDGVLYLTKYTHGILSVFNAREGVRYYGPQRMQGLREIMASPVAADGRVYITGRDGTTVVIRHGERYEVLATNTLDDHFSASMALVGDEIYMRGDAYLYCIAES